MATREDKVRDFHEKLDLSPTVRMDKGLGVGFKAAVMLGKIAAVLKLESSHLEHAYDLRNPYVLRAHLMCEELAEVLEAMANQDELELLDGLADLQYVLSGTAVTFDLPLDKAFEEVHRSNMTKEKQENDKSKERVRDKGPNYQPPNLEKVLWDARR